MARITIKSAVARSLINIRVEVEKLLCTVEEWKINGVNKTGAIPISVIPLENRLRKLILELDEMIKIAKDQSL